MSDAELKQAADLSVIHVKRDLTEFSTRMIDAAYLKTYEALIEDFAAYPNDIELHGLVMVATEAKDALAEGLRVSIRPVRSMAEEQYHGGGLYKCFGFEKMNERTDVQLIRLGRKVVRVGTRLLEQLAGQGLTTGILSGIGAQAISLDDAIEAREEAIEAREIATQERIKTGNALYGAYVRICNIGKSLFADTNEAKYNDYVINDRPPAAAK